MRGRAVTNFNIIYKIALIVNRFFYLLFCGNIPRCVFQLKGKYVILMLYSCAHVHARAKTEKKEIEK